MTFHDQAVLVTGASRGLGAALARAFAGEGARVVLVARELAALEAVAAAIRQQGGEAHALCADVGDKRAIYPLAAAAAELVGPIDVLVHNASTLGATPLRLLLDTECEDLERVLAVNLIGPFRLSRVLAGNMAVRRRGAIVHVSSDAAVTPYARWGAYSASKAAQDHLARVWAEELSLLGIRVLSVDPGEMDTEMHAAAIPEADRSTLAAPEEVARRIVGMVHDPRIGSGTRVKATDWQAPA